MWAKLVEESNGQVHKIIAVARDEATSAFRGADQVLLIRQGSGVFLAGANRVDSFRILGKVAWA